MAVRPLSPATDRRLGGPVFFGVIDSGGSATFSNIMLNGSAVAPGEPELPDNPDTPEDPVLPPASGKSPADFGWETDNDNYTGWTVDENGTTYTVTYDGVNSKRIWKELITDADNFTVSFDTIVLKQRIEIEIMGIKLELNASGGNGNQLYIKDKDAWMNANGQRASVTLTRENGGDLNVKYVGAGSSTAVTFTKKIYDESNLNVHLGVIDNGGSAVFYNILPVIDIPDAGQLRTGTAQFEGNKVRGCSPEPWRKIRCDRKGSNQDTYYQEGGRRIRIRCTLIMAPVGIHKPE